MRKKILFAFVLISAFGFISCSDRKDQKPEIDFHELGYENSKKVKAGDELHFDAEIVAKNKIDKIRIEIHPEGDDHKSILLVLLDNAWEFDTTYTEFSGLKNVGFHKHIIVPEHAAAGDYHFHFAVTDQEGNMAIFEDEIEVIQ